MIDDSNSITTAAPAKVSVSGTDALHLSVVVVVFFCTNSGENRSPVFRQRISLHPAFFGICKLQLVTYAQCSSSSFIDSHLRRQWIAAVCLRL